MELDDWKRLTTCFPLLSEEDDSVVWPHSSSGRFSAKSAYAKLISGAHTVKFKDIWSARIPPKIKKILWQAFRRKLPAADQIRKRNGPGSDRCAYVGLLKTPSTYFFIARWLNSFGVALDIGFMLIGIHLPSRTCGDVSVLYQAGLREYSGLVGQRSVGRCGLLETSSLSSIFFRLTL